MADKEKKNLGDTGKKDGNKASSRKARWTEPARSYGESTYPKASQAHELIRPNVFQIQEARQDQGLVYASVFQVTKARLVSVRDLRNDPNEQLFNGWVNTDEATLSTGFAILMEFNQPVNESTFNDITVKYEMFSQSGGDGGRLAGVTSFNFFSNKFAFVPNQSYSDILGAGRPNPAENLVVSIRLSGSSGPITDADGNIWPFSGIHSKELPDSASTGTISEPAIGLSHGKLIDGNYDLNAGGDYFKEFVIIG